MHDAPERPARVRVLAPPPVLFLLGFLSGLGLERLHSLGLGTHLPLALAGGALVALGLALVGASLRTLARHRTTIDPYRAPKRLVTSGPFARSRNPIYVGFTIAYAGTALLLGAAWPLVLLPVVLVLLQVGVVRVEERALLRAFGEDYDEYRRRVRRWL